MTSYSDYIRLTILIKLALFFSAIPNAMTLTFKLSNFKLKVLIEAMQIYK